MTSCIVPPCEADFSACPFDRRKPISVLRFGKDVMPFREGSVVSTFMADYVPPALLPGYMGHLPRIAYTFGDTYGNGSRKYFNSYRHDILTNTARPKFVYGRLPANFIPWPEVAVAQKAICLGKLHEHTKLRPKNVDECREKELKYFLKNYQCHRDYYLDKTNSVPYNGYFWVGRPYPTKCPVDEREFKIPRKEDYCNLPNYVGPTIPCNAIGCIQDRGLRRPWNIPMLQRSPFRCSEEKHSDLPRTITFPI